MSQPHIPSDAKWRVFDRLVRCSNCGYFAEAAYTGVGVPDSAWMPSCPTCGPQLHDRDLDIVAVRR